MKGKIQSICCDLEHYRILYVLTIHEKKPELYAFTEGQLYPITSVVANTLTINTEIIPFFSPADNTQIVMMDK